MSHFNTFFGITCLGPQNIYKYSQGSYDSFDDTQREENDKKIGHIDEESSMADLNGVIVEDSTSKKYLTTNETCERTLEFTSITNMKEAKCKHHRPSQDPQQIYVRPLTTSQEIGWKHKHDLSSTLSFKMNNQNDKKEREECIRKQFADRLILTRKKLRQCKKQGTTTPVEHMQMRETFPRKSSDITLHAQEMVKIGKDWL